MDKLDDLFRGFRSGVAAPSEDAVSAAREVLLREIGSIEKPPLSRPKRRWVFAGIASAILVGGLLVTPAFGLGSRLLDLTHDRSATREVQTPVWSPDGQKIAFVRAFGRGTPFQKNEIYVMNADGSMRHSLTRNAIVVGSAPAWSADGRRIAFRSRRDGDPEIYVMNADGSGLRRLTRNPANERWFAWSPDGRKLSFVRNSEVYVVNADGNGQQRLTQRSE